MTLRQKTPRPKNRLTSIQTKPNRATPTTPPMTKTPPKMKMSTNSTRTPCSRSPLPTTVRRRVPSTLRKTTPSSTGSTWVLSRCQSSSVSRRVLAVTLIHEGGGIQLQAFATPRSEGLWNTVRKQLASGVTSQGGEASELHTALGRELAVEVPAKTEDGRPGKRDMRFAGVDGPRWFVRAVFSGKAVTNDEIRSELSALFRGVIVDRGQEAMAPRELIVLTAPEVNGDSETEDEDKDELNPFERGPEITEVR